MVDALSLINVAFLFTAVVMSGITVYNILIKKKRDSRVKIIKDDRTYNIVLVSALILGIIVRLWKFGIIPGGFNQDGAMAAVDGLALARYGTDRFGTFMPAHLYAWGSSQMSSLLSYLIAILLKVFKMTPVIVRLPQLLVSIMGAIFFYLFMKDTFGKKIGLIAAICVAINPWHFMQSRWALEANLLPHFFMAGLYFFNKGIMDKKKYVYISMIFFGFSMYCYGIAIYVIPFFLLMAAIYYFIKKKLTIKNILISVLVYFAIAWPFILTMMINYFKWDTIELPFVTMQYFKYSVRANDILFFSHNIGRQLLINSKYLLNMTILQKKDAPWNYISGFGTMYYFTMPFIFVGLISFIKGKIKGDKALVIMLIITGIWTGLVTDYVNVNRLNIIYYGLMMLTVVGVYQVILQMKEGKVVIPVMYMAAFILFIGTYFTSYVKLIGEVFYDGFGEAVLKAEESGSQKIYITSDIQTLGNYKVSEIMTMFYNKMDAKYFQGETNVNNGKEYLPYSERYHYMTMTIKAVDATLEEDASYVILNRDKIYFHGDYEITDYGNYAVVIKK